MQENDAKLYIIIPPAKTQMFVCKVRGAIDIIIIIMMIIIMRKKNETGRIGNFFLPPDRFGLFFIFLNLKKK